jgi:hypothetical protein
MIYEGCMHKVSFNIIPCKDVDLGTVRIISAVLGSHDRRARHIEIYKYTCSSAMKGLVLDFEFGYGGSSKRGRAHSKMTSCQPCGYSLTFLIS